MKTLFTIMIAILAMEGSASSRTKNLLYPKIKQHMYATEFLCFENLTCETASDGRPNSTKPSWRAESESDYRIEYSNEEMAEMPDVIFLNGIFRVDNKINDVVLMDIKNTSHSWEVTSSCGSDCTYEEQSNTKKRRLETSKVSCWSRLKQLSSVLPRCSTLTHGELEARRKKLSDYKKKESEISQLRKEVEELKQELILSNYESFISINTCATEKIEEKCDESIVSDLSRMYMEFAHSENDGDNKIEHKRKPHQPTLSDIAYRTVIETLGLEK